MSGRTAPWRIGWWAFLAACVVVAQVAGLAVSGSNAAVAPQGISGWTAVGSYDQNTLTAGEGVATVFQPPHGSTELYRGIQSVPPDLKAEGWTHIGDPDSIHGYVIDAYQGLSARKPKMFLVTTPSGKTYQYVHTLVRGELYNNSFDAISPDSQWMIGGEWGTMTHLQIFPTPLLNRGTSRTGGPLRLAGYVQLDHKVNDVQGCDFVTAAKLICASDDNTKSLFPVEKPLLEIDLPGPLHGHTVRGHVVDLGPIPQQSTCSGSFEDEGVDFDVATGTLRVEMIQPGSCILTTRIYEYKAAHGRG